MAMVRLFVLLGALLVVIVVAVAVIVIVASNSKSRRLPPAAQPGWPQGVGQAGQWPGQPPPGAGLPLPLADHQLLAGQQPLAGHQLLAGQQPLAGQPDPEHEPPPREGERPSS